MRLMDTYSMDRVALGTVMIVEDDPFIGLAVETSLKSAGFNVLANLQNAKDAITSYSIKPSDLVLLDLDLGIGPNGIDVAHALRKLNSNVGIILLTTFVDPRFADTRNLIPPKGTRYLVKSEISDVSQLIKVLLQTKHSPFIENMTHMNKFNALTDLQIEVWKAVSEGQSSIEIAEQRGISEKAVEAIISRIYTFLEIKKTKSINPRVVLANSFNKLAGKLR